MRSKYIITTTPHSDQFQLITEAEKNRIQAVLDENKADVDELRNVVVSILKLLGIWDEKTNSVKNSIKTGQESYLPSILKGLGDVTMLAGQAQIPVIGKKAEAKLLEKFHFLKNLIPIIEKHANNE